MGSTPLGYCWFIYKIGARTGRLTGQFETYALSYRLKPASLLDLRDLAPEATRTPHRVPRIGQPHPESVGE